MLESADEERELRAGRNQSLFRAVNEEIEALNAGSRTGTTSLVSAETGAAFSVLAEWV